MNGVNSLFSKLLSPGQLGPLEVRNRIVLPAMDQNNCTEEGLITDETVAHYETRAKGGVGLLIVETSAVSYPHGATARRQPALSDDKAIPGLRRLADAVHAHGAKIIVQICHHGKTSGVDISEGRPALIPSLPPPPSDPRGMMADTTMDELLKMATLTGGQMPSYAEATTGQLVGIVQDFADAANRVQQAGFDGVEIHAAHGYLLSTFLSPAWNRRDDVYGGSLEGRTRLLTDVVVAVRQRCGPEFVIVVRLDGHEYGVEGGITVQDATEHARAAVAASANAIHVSAISSAGTGVGFTDAPIPWQPNQYERFAKHVKEGVNVPVLAVGRIGPSDGERILDNGNADFISMGRQLLADPNLVQRLDAGRPELVRPCINCLVCVAQNFWSGQPVCAVNPQLGHYDKPDPVPTGQPRHVVVVGGGPGGMECALVAAERGHRVTLLEASEQLGGTARFSALTTPVNGELVEFFRAAIAEAGVEVQTGVRADSQLIGGLEPDVVVVATGSRRDLPDLPGVDLPHVLSGDDLRAQLTGETDLGRLRLGMLTRLLLRASRLLRLTVDMGRVRWLSRLWMPIGRRVVVVNGDLVGTEIARFLADRGRTVHVLEPGKQPAVAMAHPRRWRVLHEARRAGVTFHTEADPTSISPTQIEYRQADTAGQLDADTVILAGDVRADRSLAEELSADGHEVHVVGDADEEWYIEGAVRSGHRVGAAL
ncbi:MAG: NAD(P)/FAD-dependent oxidoreductase [Acidimicrobiales bacterium]|nr:NAD(P)/FAD-dependent oxidoreductase [Acidimicrobiales bacterium]